MNKCDLTELLFSVFWFAVISPVDLKGLHERFRIMCFIIWRLSSRVQYSECIVICLSTHMPCTDETSTRCSSSLIYVYRTKCKSQFWPWAGPLLAGRNVVTILGPPWFPPRVTNPPIRNTISMPPDTPTSPAYEAYDLKGIVSPKKYYLPVFII